MAAAKSWDEVNRGLIENYTRIMDSYKFTLLESIDVINRSLKND